jgi:ribosomal protein S18 acetylase RimI-like enzyme
MMGSTDRFDPNAISFRPIEDQDQPLLRALYASTRADEMAMVPHWSEIEKASFLDHQFNAQHDWYHKVYSDASFLIIQYEGKPAGRMYIHRQTEEIRLIEITILPELRNRGLGEYLIRNLMEEAAGEGKAVRIHVEHFNRALKLYERLGFKVLDVVNGVYLYMEWRKPE